MDEGFLWLGPLGDRGGYGNVARNYLRGLIEVGTHVSPRPFSPPQAEIGERDHALLASAATPPRGDETLVAHADPTWLGANLPALREGWGGRIAACTIAETDRLPAEWAQACNLADEVWVPTTFNELTFARSGVEPGKLRLVPYGLDVAAWEPEGPRLEVAPEDHTVFVYTFAFDWRKGFDLLLEAYLGAFDRDDPVTLVIKCYDPRGAASLRGVLAASVADKVDLFRQDLPRVVVLDQPMDRAELTALLRRADLYISTDRANGWGMPAMEAMALGRATATIDWSGSTEFMTAETSLLIPPGELVAVDARLSTERPAYQGQRWPHVAVEDVRAVLRAAASGEADLAALGARGREAILDRWTTRHAGAYVVGRDRGAYTRRDGLADRLRPQLGLAAEAPLAEARSSVLVAEWRSGGPWTAALDAYLQAFSPADDVTLCLWAQPGVDEHLLAADVLRALGERGVDPAAAPDLMACAAAADEALADPRVRAVIAPAPSWPFGRPTIPAAPEALRGAACAPAGVPAAA